MRQSVLHVNKSCTLDWLINFFMQVGNNWISSHLTTFSAIDQSYSLPDNIAIITLEVFITELSELDSCL